MNEIHTVEYSYNQQGELVFHVDCLKKTLETNLSFMKRNTNCSWGVIAVCDSYEEAHRFLDELKKTV